MGPPLMLFGRKKKWHFTLLISEKIFSIMLHPEVPLKIWLEVFSEFYGNSPNVLISQCIEKKYLNNIDVNSLLQKIKNYSASELLLTSNYKDLTSPNENDDFFVINFFGEFNKSMANELFQYSLANPSTIMNQVISENLGWEQELLLRNKTVMDWFSLKENSEILLEKYIEEKGSLEITIDGNPTFFFIDTKSLYKFLHIINEVAIRDKYNLEINIRTLKRTK